MKLLLLHLLLILFDSTVSVCEGNWKASEDSAYHFDGFGDGGIGNSLKFICPADTLMHNCLFHKSIDRNMMIQNREWISKDTECVEYNSFKLLEFLQDRKLIYLVILL